MKPQINKESIMKVEQLERGNEIKSEIRQLNEQLEKWQQADKLKVNSFVRLASSDDYSNIDVRPHYINFDNMKRDAIETIQKELSEFQAEFDTL
ncbi:MAG: hypothetical protein ABIN91_11190 [Mucilaginibacter sp.]|uniref:hypothetical protein n=1 Tax=Mucilaginibacter sp. TaxID=1882438 RepID=UPI003263F1DC